MVYLYNSSTKQYDYYSNTTSTNMTITKLNSATVYQIKVRAYRTLNKTNYYGSYSSVLTIRLFSNRVLIFSNTSPLSYFHALTSLLVFR